MKNIIIKSLREKQKENMETAEVFFHKPKNEIEDTDKKPYEPKKLKKIACLVFSFFFVLIVGGIGGILIDRFTLPYLLVKYPRLNQYEFLKRVNERTTIVEIIKNVRISEDEAVIDTIKKAMPSIVKIAQPSAKEGLYSGTGIILTSDGLIITSTINIAETESQAEKNTGKNKSETFSGVIKVKLANEKIYDAKTVAKDNLTGLVIIKINETNLPVVPFGDSDNLELGEKLVILDDSVMTDIVSKFIDDYILPEEIQNHSENGTFYKKQKRIKIANGGNNLFYGSSVLNIKGEIVGIGQSDGLFIPINEMAKFIDGAMGK